MFNEILQTQYEDINFITVERKYKNTYGCANNNYETYNVLDEKKINDIFYGLTGCLMKNNNFLNFVVFNESFFGKHRPLNTTEVDAIEKKIIDLSKNFENTIFYVNFLKIDKKRFLKKEVFEILKRTLFHLVEQSDTFIFGDGKLLSIYLENLYIAIFKEIQEDFKLISTSLYNHYRLGENPITKEQIEACLNNRVNLVDDNFWDEEVELDVISNVTFSYHNGLKMTDYYKTSYYEEADNLLKTPQTVYYLGDGKDHDLANTFLSKALVRCISNQICADILRYTRGKEETFLENEQGYTSVFHLLLSNSFSIKNDIFPIKDFHRYFKIKKFIIHADSKEGNNGWIYRNSYEKTFLLGQLKTGGTSSFYTVIEDENFNYVVTTLKMNLNDNSSD